VLAAVLMPLTFSIAHGIAIGFITYALIKLLSGKMDQLNTGSIAIAVISVIYFIAI
jgi:AGZA family xanthine/uracil permease-like MFS transporter